MWQPSEPGRVLAIDFGGTKVAVATGDGSRLRARAFDFPTNPESVLSLAKELSWEIDVSAPDVVSVSTPGVVIDGHPQNSPNVENWDGVDLEAWARASWPGARVLVTNDVELAAHAEASIGALSQADIGLYVNLGTGIAGATIVRGQVLPGAHGVAGEIGYSRVGAVNEIQWTNAVASLELLSGGAGFRAAGITIPDQGADWLESPPGSASKAALDELARHLATLVLLLDPRLVVFGGGLSDVSLVVDHLRNRILAVALAPPEIRQSKFGSHASTLGALIIGTKRRS